MILKRILFAALILLAAGPFAGRASHDSLLRGRADALTEGALALDKEKIAEAAEQHEQALEIYEKLRDHRKIADTRLFLATIADRRGEPEVVIEHLHHGLDSLRRLDDPAGLWLYEILRATAEDGAGRKEAAIATFREGLGLLDRMEAAETSPVFETFAVYGRQTYCPNAEGWGLLTSGQSRQALRFLRAMNLKFLADLEYEAGDFEIARAHYRESLKSSWPLNLFEEEIHKRLGEIEGELGNFADARKALETSLEIARETSEWEAEIEALEALAELELWANNPEAARARYEEVLELAQLMAHDELEARTLETMAREAPAGKNEP